MMNITNSNALKIVLIICSIGSAAAQPLPREKPMVEPTVEILAPPDVSCIAWTDDCRACARSDSVITCSNVATVCPAERTVRCLKRGDPTPPKK